MENSHQEYCISIVKMLNFVGIFLSILGSATCLLDVIICIYCAAYNVKITIFAAIFPIFAIGIYFYTTLLNIRLVRIDKTKDKKHFYIIYNIFAFLALTSAFIDGCLKIFMFNFFISFAFFMYFIFGSLTLCITCTANEDLRREREGEPDDDDQLTTVSTQDSMVNKKAKKINNNKQVYQKVPTEVPVISKEVAIEEATITKDQNKEYTGKVTHL
ncbi:unnamed protein product [Chironomus riparius]|uniref:Uncharacterized protein n=1 Tax=Chironomus riparius TaxID=315576 RepID=A0A9N9SB11_9DIPT|nr:unnamed protein product [Chironomus riparius]